MDGMAEFVEEDALWRSIDGACDQVCASWINLRPFALNYWLQDKIRKEKRDETRAAGIYQEAL